MIADLGMLGEWKIQLTMKMKFMSSEDGGESQHICSKSDDREIMIGADANEIIKELLNSLLQRYQTGLEQSLKSAFCACLC